MSITYRPPFDEDDERDLRALYRKPGPGANPELDAAVRRRWHPGHSWHPGWGALACAVMVAGLFAWTDMREAADLPDLSAQLIPPPEVVPGADTPPAPQAVASDAQPVTLRRVVALQPEPAANQEPAVQASTEAAPEAATQEAAPESAQGEAAQAQTVVAFTEQDIEARVAQIRNLIVNDREEEAVQALRELQRGAPDLALPDDLQELSRQNPA
ncbi:hypothetical protein [Achromobacter arsenitoxydans]|uniref:Uncharacterized protein n=1 Tax=Achromobacter arsenitoxydans SY8 TaxID=477184 RepID=H0F421_9BURK|nr:hypothetical protein [Achromobacter arsenitoxydans]EHK66916.1 hypothetical protein KYC_07565 [Achromobacter arsenitoxydans SY8]